MKKAKFLAIPVLAAALAACGVAQWVKTAQQILPVVLPMITNLVTAVSLLEGKTVSPADFRAISSTASQVSGDLNLVGQLVNQYEGSKDTTTVDKINSTLADVNAHLSALLTAVHISDPATVEKVTAIVTLIDTEVNSIEQILPIVSNGQSKAVVLAAHRPLSAPELKAEYNRIVSQSTSNAAVNAAFAKLTLK